MRNIFVTVDYSNLKDYSMIVVLEKQDDGGVCVLKDFESEREFIFWLFNGRCIGVDDICYKRATELSHIIPRSSGKKSEDWRNKVLHCTSCHSEYHRRGVSDEAISKMQQRRAEQLEMLGKEEYI